MEIVSASKDYLEQYCDYVMECYLDGNLHYEDAASDPQSYLNKVIANSSGHQLPQGWVPSSTYFAIENGRILGAIRVRKGTNDYIRNVIGHIGYETRPSERGRGVAKAMLLWVTRNQLAKEAIVTCSADNHASRKVIEACGGTPLESYIDDNVNRKTLRFKLSSVYGDINKPYGLSKNSHR